MKLVNFRDSEPVHLGRAGGLRKESRGLQAPGGLPARLAVALKGAAWRCEARLRGLSPMAWFIFIRPLAARPSPVTGLPSSVIAAPIIL